MAPRKSLDVKMTFGPTKGHERREMPIPRLLVDDLRGGLLAALRMIWSLPANGVR